MQKKIIQIFLFLWFPYLVNSQSIVNTVHNLSAGSTGSIKATTETEICIFCHTPHGSAPVGPLWNRDDPGLTYTLYNSSTIDALPGQPDGSSILCLSCHDGTIALGNIYSEIADISMLSGVTTMPVGKSNLSQLLNDDHPISFVYNSSLVLTDGKLKDPASITLPVELENEKVQCTSCHDPHNNTYSKFLVTSSQYSALCLSCHERPNWINSSHKNSDATWTTTNPWTHTDYTTVSENACENCHRPHSAGSSELIMKYPVGEDNCLDCHNGNVALSTKNIETHLSKYSAHNVSDIAYEGIHDANEAALVSVQHVECADCHNPHAARQNTQIAPNVKGANEGVKGIDQSGNPVDPISYEYELCYRCHADSPNKPASATSRSIVQNNVRLEFDINNPSHHAVTGVGENNSVPSLISPLTVSSIIYCTDCHASDGSGPLPDDPPLGPHGSIYPTILKYNYETTDGTPYLATNFELCYTCHSEASILSDNTFGEHYVHIVVEATSCNVCHDPHGISISQGNTTNNTHLINFDISAVSLAAGQRIFVDEGINTGYCLLRCHTRGHSEAMSRY
ncbi:MAG TPA: hypothetical protein DCG75_16450 [Bacteroidales bacterium]|jgi:predicted CXXCH cytochrome family protein|nr:hypothetical protein [Bacteroidales bacterium]